MGGRPLGRNGPAREALAGPHHQANGG